MLIPFSGLNHVPLCYEFVERHNGGQNFIVMMLLGKNLAKKKNKLGQMFTVNVAVDYLVGGYLPPLSCLLTFF
jgi:hypothetical protein